MMARQVARQFYRLEKVHSLVYGRCAGSKNGRKLTASTWVGSQSRLMNIWVKSFDDLAKARIKDYTLMD